MKTKRAYGCNTSFLDLLFNMLLAFTALFVLSFAMINQNKDQNKNTQIKAQYIITVTWPDDFDNDVDTYIEDPEDHLVCFRRREDGLMHLDRDDLGKRNDAVQINGKSVEYPYNRELVTIRTAVEGEYCINVHAYRFNDRRPCDVTVQIEKLDPYSLVAINKATLLQSGDEKTVVRFKLNKKGEFLSTNTMQKKLVSASHGQATPFQAPSYENFLPPETPPAPPSQPTIPGGP